VLARRSCFHSVNNRTVVQLALAAWYWYWYWCLTSLNIAQMISDIVTD